MRVRQHFYLLSIVLLLSNCSKNDTVDDTQYYKKCTSYEITIGNDPLNKLFAINYQEAPNNKYEVKLFTFTTIYNTGEKVINGTTTKLYDRPLFTSVKIKENCYKSIIP